MKFGASFEYHKIPEWYMMYLDYHGLKKKIEDFKEKCKKGEYTKLPGYYLFTNSRALVNLDMSSPISDSTLTNQDSGTILLQYDLQNNEFTERQCVA